jgi:phage terminase large subunit
MTIAKVEIAPKLLEVFTAPRGELRYRGAYGGRGSAKSFTFAKMAAIWGAVEPLRVLCTRELQDSIKESFHAELKAAIASEPWLDAHYDVGIDFLRGKNGTEFLFKGLRHNIGSIKSLSKIDLCIVEEAEDVPEASWQALEPTIRAPKSEIWVIWNPKLDGSPVDQRFVKTTPPRSCIVNVNYEDNPWFPDVLEEQRAHQQRVLDPETYAHIWLGKYLKMGKASVFSGKWRVDQFEPRSDWAGPYYGLDFGFAQDPTAGIKAWIGDGRLYVEYECGGVGIELDDTAQIMIDELPGIDKHVVRADSARPESISHLKRHGLPRIISCEKGKGSVEDGIAHIKSYEEVVIHPRCKRTQNEFLLYSYKTDRFTGDVLPVLVDANNHFIDALRYALEPVIKNKGKIRINPSLLARA